MAATEKPTMLIAVDDAVERGELETVFGKEYTLVDVTDGKAALRVLESRPINIVLVSASLAYMDATELLNAMRERDQLSRVPAVVIIDAEDAEELETAALDAGAADVITRPYNMTTMCRRVHNSLGRAENEWRKLVQEAHDRELTTLKGYIECDSLTGLYNRETFYRKAAEVMQANRDLKYQIIYFDISYFKVINDLFHADTGNLILQTAAYYFKAFSGVKGVCSRMEADHFVLCVPENSTPIEALISGLDTTMESLAINHNIVFLAGIYPVDNAYLPVDQMCDRANMALKKIKGQYAVRYAYYDSGMREQMLQEQMIVRDMELALHEKHFVIHLQPVVNVQTQLITGAEALIRWDHPGSGIISPGKFVSVFERNGFIVRLDRYVWEEVCRLLRQQLDTLGKAVPISVNISRLNFYNEDLLQFLLGLLQKYRLTPDMLKLEITETAYNDDPTRLIQAVEELRRHGFAIMMDDFGSGFSSLSMLKNLPVDILKIDIDFVREIGHKPRVDAIMKYMMELSGELGMSVIIEGVETAEQVKTLEAFGVKQAQGFYFSPPMPVSEFLSALERKEAFTTVNGEI